MPKAMPGQLTLGSLRVLVGKASDDGVPDDTPIFWYFGDDTLVTKDKIFSLEN